MIDRRKWEREKEELENAERKAIISRHQDAMTAADRQGELQLIAKLSSLLSTNPSSQCSLSLPIIPLCSQWENSTTPSAVFDYSFAACACIRVSEHTYSTCACILQLLAVCATVLKSWCAVSSDYLTVKADPLALSVSSFKSATVRDGGSGGYWTRKSIIQCWKRNEQRIQTAGKDDVLYCTHLMYCTYKLEHNTVRWTQQLMQKCKE